jgi:hypothetical protein
MLHFTSDIDRYGPLVVFISVLLAEAGLPLPGFPILWAMIAEPNR